MQTLANYHENLTGIANEIHPFSVLDNSLNDSESVISVRGFPDLFSWLATKMGHQLKAGQAARLNRSP